MNKYIKAFLPYLLALILLGLDQWSKYMVRQHMALGESIPLVGNIFHLTYIENDGVAFGLFAGYTGAFIIVSLLVLAVLLGFAWHEKNVSAWLSYGVALVASGALGNIIDRAMKASVTDMFDFRIWPIFNVADMAVCAGFVCLIVYVFRDQGEKDDAKNPDRG